MVISSIVRNISALEVVQRMHQTENDLSANIERLSTGLRIRSSADNPGDMTILTKLRSRIRSVDQASLNAQSVVNMAATATTALSDVIARLQSIRTKAVAAANTSTSDVTARAGYQAEIQQMIDEMDRIAAATSFGGKRLLDGSYGSTTRFTEPDRFPGAIAFGADASTLRTGTSILNITRTQAGSARFATGDTGGMSLGIANNTDVAVSIGQFESGGVIAAAGASLGKVDFAKVSLQSGGLIQFSGVIADGTTAFRGELTIGADTRISNLVTALQSAIDAAESSIGVNGAGTGPYETVVSYDAATTGRLRFTNGQGNTYSQFSITFTLKDAAAQTQTISGSTRAPNIYYAAVGGSTSGAELGNSLTSITGSTFDTGTFKITVSDATSAQQRTLSTTYAFTDALGAAVSLGSNIAGSRLFNGTTTLTLSTGNTADFTGTNPDGTTFSGTITFVAVDTGVGQGDATTFQDLINELNHRDRTDTFYGWTNATATLVSGEIQLIDDIAATSSTAFQMVVNATSGTAVDDGVVVYSGNAERATISIAGGETQTVDAGSVVTFEGVESTVPGRTYQVTFRVGENLFDGSDDLAVTAQAYAARLNNGPAVTFRNGDRGVVVRDGLNPTGNVPGAQQIKLDFDTILGVTADTAAGGEKFTLETTADRLNFHIGPDEDEYRQFAFFDVRSTNLGLSAGNRLADINVTTITGAENAIEVVDAALDQLNLVNSVVGSLESRMQDTSGDLALYSLNLQNAETAIASADVAKETTELVMNYILVNSQTSALVQATLIPKTVFSILAGHQLP